MIMELIARTGTYRLNENDESVSYLEAYRLPENFVKHVEEDCLPTDGIMEELGFSNERGFVEPGAVYSEYAFVSLNTTTRLLVIEITQSLNI